MKKIIITGGCGFIGSYLVTEALKKNLKLLTLIKLAMQAEKCLFLIKIINL